MTNQHGDFIWYELMTTDADAAQKFYEGLVGWTFKSSGQPDMDYRLFSADGPEVGGLMGLTREMQEGGAQPLWAGYIGVDNVDEAAVAVTKADGKVLMPAWDIQGVGRLAFVTDPQGAPFYLMSDSSGQTSEAFAAYKPRRGHCAWNELVTDSPDGAKEFYREVFGWVKTDSMDMGEMGEYEMLRNGAERDFVFGAVMRKPAEMPVSLWSFYFRVESIDKAVTFVNDNGGQVVNGPMEIPDGEYVINGVDPQGAFFSLIGPR